MLPVVSEKVPVVPCRIRLRPAVRRVLTSGHQKLALTAQIGRCGQRPRRGHAAGWREGVRRVVIQIRAGQIVSIGIRTSGHEYVASCYLMAHVPVPSGGHGAGNRSEACRGRIIKLRFCRGCATGDKHFARREQCRLMLARGIPMLETPTNRWAQFLSSFPQAGLWVSFRKCYR